MAISQKALGFGRLLLPYAFAFEHPSCRHLFGRPLGTVDAGFGGNTFHLDRDGEMGGVVWTRTVIDPVGGCQPEFCMRPFL